MYQILITIEQTEQGEQIHATANATVSPVYSLGLLEAAKQIILAGKLNVMKEETSDKFDELTD